MKLEFKFGLENGKKRNEKKKIRQNPANGPRISHSAHLRNLSRGSTSTAPTSGAHVPYTPPRLLSCRAGPAHQGSPRPRLVWLTCGSASQPLPLAHRAHFHAGPSGQQGLPCRVGRAQQRIREIRGVLFPPLPLRRCWRVQFILGIKPGRPAAPSPFLLLPARKHRTHPLLGLVWPRSSRRRGRSLPLTAIEARITGQKVRRWSSSGEIACCGRTKERLAARRISPQLSPLVVPSSET